MDVSIAAGDIEVVAQPRHGYSDRICLLMEKAELNIEPAGQGQSGKIVEVTMRVRVDEKPPESPA